MAPHQLNKIQLANLKNSGTANVIYVKVVSIQLKNTKPNSEICLPSKKGLSIQIAPTFTKADLGLTI